MQRIFYDKETVNLILGSITELAGAAIDWILQSFFSLFKIRHELKERQIGRDHQLMRESCLGAYEAISEICFNTERYPIRTIGSQNTTGDKPIVGLKQLLSKFVLLELIGSSETNRAKLQFHLCATKIVCELDSKAIEINWFVMEDRRLEDMIELYKTHVNELFNDISNEYQKGAGADIRYIEGAEKLKKEYSKTIDELFLKKMKNSELHKKNCMNFEGYVKSQLPELFNASFILSEAMRKDLKNKFTIDEDFMKELNEHHDDVLEIFKNKDEKVRQIVADQTS